MPINTEQFIVQNATKEISMKFKYLEFRERPFNVGELVAQVDVSLLNKRGIELKWSELEKTFPKENYQSCLTETKQERTSFIKTKNGI